MDTTIKLNKYSLTVAIALASMSCPSISFAQSQSGTAFGLDEVIVTATRKEETLNTVPVSVTALSGSQIEALGAQDIADVQTITPNFNVQTVVTRPNDPILVIRGVLKRDGDATLDTAVGVYSDDVFLARGYSVMGQLLDVDRIEVLRGPQGTLFGRNTIGGAVQVISKKPVIGGGADGHLSVSAGNFDMFKVSAGATAQLSDTLAVRLAGKYQNHSGYTTSYLVDDTGPNGYTPGDPILDEIDTHDADDYSLRASLAWEPTANTRIDLSGYRSKTDTNGVLSKGLNGDLGVLSPTFFGSTTPCFPGGCGIANGDSAVSGGDFYKGLTDVRPNADGEVGIYVAKVEHDFGGVTGKFIASFADAENTSQLNTDGVVGFMQPLVVSGLPLPPPLIGRESSAFADGDVEQKTFELQFNGDIGDRTDWIAGLYYFKEEANDFIYLATSNITPTGAPVNIVDVTAENDSQSIYGSVSHGLNDDLKLRLGGRYTKDSKGFEGRSRLFVPGAGISLCAFDQTIVFPSDATRGGNVDPNCRLTNIDDTNSFTWDVSLDYQLSDDVFTYGKVSTGYRTGGISLNAVSLATAVPFVKDEVTNYELGVKADLGNFAHVNAALFYADYTDIQQNVISSVVPTLGLACAPGYAGPPVVLTCNIGDGTIKGIEVDAVIELTENFSVLATYGYTDLSYDNAAFSTVFLPESTFSVSADYATNIAGRPINAVLSYQHSDEWAGGIPNGGVAHDYAVVDGYSLLNARLNVDIRDDLSLALWAKNITKDEYYGTSVTVTSPLFQINSGVPGAPRTYGVDLKYTF